jgi:hypothetical protein
MVSCRLCHKDIDFSDDPQFISKSGKMIPLDVDPAGVITGKHDCPVWELQHRKYYQCRKCGKEIYFDDKAAKSKLGKMVPQDPNTGAPHQCPEDTY